MPPSASQLIERLELNPTNMEQIKGVNITPISVPNYLANAISQQGTSQEELAQKKKNKLVIGVAIGVGVISIVSIIYLLRKK